MNNLYKEMVRKPGDLCFEVSLESDKGLTMTDLSFALKFFVYGHPKNVCIRKDDLEVVEGKYYAVLNEHGFVNGVLFCEAEIVETINGINRIVSVRSNTGYMIGNCCQPSVDTSSCAHGYSLSLYKVEYVPQPIDPNPEPVEPHECELTAEELFGERLSLPELTADRAIADEHGNRIADTYETRQAVRSHIREVYNEQFTEKPPLIMDEYITPRMLSEGVKDMLSQAGATINNVPDGEDLTTKQGVLKLSDKSYNPGAYSGLGRVYLRKNLVGGQNLLTQAMVSKPNTIYIIQYDYTLDGKTITIPEGCVLSYEGGSIRDGHINYTDTLIHGTDRISNVTTSGACRHAALPTDEEDITGANGKNLKFKDKEYVPQDYSGLGRIYLRKNIKTVYSEAAQSNVTINLLEQSMIDKPNTIYIIQYDYDLNGDEITIPEDCVLDFQGGSLSNGTLVGSNTSINSTLVKIFSLDIYFKGNWCISEAYPEWFGAKADKVTDCTEAVQKTIDCFDTVKFVGDNYYLISPRDNGVCINVGFGKSLIGVHRNGSGGNDASTFGVVGNNVVGLLCQGRNTIKRISLKGINDIIINQSKGSFCVGIKTQNNHITIEEVDVRKFEVGFYIQSYLTCVMNCRCIGSKVGFYCKGDGAEDWYDAKAPISRNTSITLNGCYATSCPYGGYVFFGITYSSIISCAADGCGIPIEDTIIDNVDTIMPAYNFLYCVGMSVVATGAELCGKFIKTKRCTSITFESCTIAVGLRIKSDENAVLREIIRVDYSSGIKLNKLIVESEGSATIENSSIFVSEDGYTDIEMASAMTNNCNNLFISRNNCANWGSKNTVINVCLDRNLFGESSDRPNPSILTKGQYYFDTTLNKPIFSIGSKWVDATGAEV